MRKHVKIYFEGSGRECILMSLFNGIFKTKKTTRVIDNKKQTANLPLKQNVMLDDCAVMFSEKSCKFRKKILV